jgi:hypothetical protein
MSKLSQDDADFRQITPERVAISNVEAPLQAYGENPAQNVRARWPMAIIGFGLLATIVWAGVLIWLIGYLILML